MLRVAALTSVGMCRTVNEDTFTLLDLTTGGAVPEGSLPVGLESRAAVLGVYDGCSHFPEGGSASHVVARIVAARLAMMPTGATEDELSRRLIGAIQAGHREVFAANRDGGHCAGTTATVVAISGTDVRIVHIGDSRAYLFAGGQLRQVTEDDTLLRLVIASGRLTPEEIASFPHKNVVTRALGLPEELEMPPVTSLTLQSGDLLLLCTDGVWGLVDDPAIASILATHRDPSEACRALIEAANEGGGQDNETAVIALYEPDPR
jgi:protein phosphatase